MGVVTFTLTRSILSKYNLLSSVTNISKCSNQSWAILATSKLVKPTSGHTNFSCYSLKENFCRKSSLLYGEQLTNVNSLFPILMDQHIRCSTSTPDSSSTSTPDSSSTAQPSQLSKRDKLKRAVKEYGATVVIFHVTISLFSLGVAYLVVTSGVDMGSLLTKIGIGNNNPDTISSGSDMLGTTGDVAAGISSFVVAYAIHKVFAPVRVSITLLCTPLIVRHLRKIGILKPPKPSAT